jgi:hypothetical protein
METIKLGSKGESVK